MFKSPSLGLAITLLLAGTAQAKNVATITQTGDMQMLTVSQVAGSSGSATIDQAGDHNAILAYQKDSESFGNRQSPANLLKINQIGDHNTINTINSQPLPFTGQSNESPGSAANTMTIKQAGQTNEIHYGQKGFGNAALIRQGQGASRDAASQNVATVGQYQSANEATITQDGTRNELIARQNAGHDTVFVKQDGFVNTIHVNQAHDDAASVVQTGSSQFIEIKQFDSLESAVVIQGGNDNDLLLLQALPLDSATLTQNGGFNMLTVTQGTVGAVANVNQSGVINHITLNQ